MLQPPRPAGRARRPMSWKAQRTAAAPGMPGMMPAVLATIWIASRTQCGPFPQSMHLK